MRDYKKVLVQLETLEINVGDQCRKEFTGVFVLFISGLLDYPHTHTHSIRVYAGLTELLLHAFLFETQI